MRDTSDEASVDEDEDQDGAEADEEVHGTEAGPEDLQDISRGRSHSHLHFSLLTQLLSNLMLVAGGGEACW